LPTRLHPVASVRVIKDASAAARSLASASLPQRPAVRAKSPGSVIELVLRNGRVLRVAETIAADALGRLAAALDR